jgi:hypothetical protein
MLEAPGAFNEALKALSAPDGERSLRSLKRGRGQRPCRTLTD